MLNDIGTKIREYPNFQTEITVRYRTVLYAAALERDMKINFKIGTGTVELVLYHESRLIRNNLKRILPVPYRTVR